MTSKLEKIRKEEYSKYKNKSDFIILSELYDDLGTEKSFSSFIDEYTVGETIPSRIRATYVTGESLKQIEQTKDNVDIKDYFVGLTDKLKSDPITILPQEPRRIVGNIAESVVGGTLDIGTLAAELSTGKDFPEFRRKKEQAMGITLGNVLGRDIIDVDPEYWESGEANLGEQYDIPTIQEPTSTVGTVAADIGSFAAAMIGGKGLIKKGLEQIKKPKQSPYQKFQGGKGRKSEKVLLAEQSMERKAKLSSYAQTLASAEIGAQVAFDPEEMRIAYDIGQWAGDDTFLISDIFNYLDLEDPKELSEVENRIGLLGEGLALTGIVGAAFKIPKGLSKTYTGGAGLIEFLKNIKNGGPEAVEAFKKRVNQGSNSSRALKTRAGSDIEMPFLKKELDDMPKLIKNIGLLSPFVEKMFNILQKVPRSLTTRGFHTHQTFDIWKGTEHIKGSVERRAKDFAERIESNVKKLAREKNISYEEADKIFRKYLDGTINPKDISNKEARELAIEIRDYIDEFSNLLLNQLKRKTGDESIDAKNKELRKEIRANFGKYLRKTYDLYENKKYTPVKEVEDKLIARIASELIETGKYGNTKKGKEAALEQAKQRIEDIKKSSLGKNKEKIYVSHINSVFGQKELDKVFAHRKNIEPLVREFLGENIDTRYAVFRTLTTLGNTTSNIRMYDDILKVGKNKFLFKKDSKAYKYVTDRRLISGQIKGTQFHSLNGYHTTDEIAELFNNMSGINLPDWYRFFLKLKGFGQASATVLNHITHLRNTVGGALMMMGNGLNPFDTEIRKSFTIIREQFADAASKDKGFNDLYLKYQELGIVNQNVRVGEFKSLINSGDLLTSVDTSLRNRGFIENVKGDVKKGTKKAFKKVEQTYVAEDDIFRIASYEKELSFLKRANQINPSNQRLSIEELERKAAEIVKDTLPTYDYVPAAIQTLKIAPFGNFYAFHAERFRNTYHAFKRSFEEIKSGNEVLRERGMQRLSAKLVYGLGGQQMISETSKLMAGVTEQENKAIRNLLLPEWSRNSEIAYFRDDKGNLTYMDLAYQHPDSPMINTVNAALNVFLDPNTPENEIENRLFEGVFESTKELLRPFFGEAIFTDALITSYVRNGRDSEGKIIKGWDTTGEWYENLDAAFLHIFESLIPGALDQLDPTGTLKTDNLGSQVWKSLTQENPVNRYGEKIDNTTELIANTTGLRFYKVTDGGTRRALSYKVNDYGRSRRSKTKEALKVNWKQPVEEILNQYIEANKDLFNDHVTMKLAIEGARELGVSSWEVLEEVKGLPGISGYEKSLLVSQVNNFIPITISEDKLVEIFEKASFDNMGFLEFKVEYFKLRQHLLQLPLIDLLFIDDITDEDKEALETLKEEDFQKYKEKREAKFTGGEISKDYPVSNVIKNPSDKLIDNENISYNEKANNLNKTQIEMKRLGFKDGTPKATLSKRIADKLLDPKNIDFLTVNRRLTSDEYLLKQKDRLKLDDISDEDFIKINNAIFDMFHFLESDRGKTNKVLGGTQLSPKLKKEAEDNLYQHNHITEEHLKYLRNKSSKDLDLENEKLLMFTVFNFRPIHDSKGKYKKGLGDELYKKVIREPTKDNIIELYQKQWLRADPKRYKEITGDNVEKNWERLREPFTEGGLKDKAFLYGRWIPVDKEKHASISEKVLSDREIKRELRQERIEERNKRLEEIKEKRLSFLKQKKDKEEIEKEEDMEDDTVWESLVRLHNRPR